MAQIKPNESPVSPSGVRASFLTAQYVGMQTGDIGAPPQGDTATCQAASLQVTGVFGVEGAVVVEGTNDGENWSLLRDPTGTTITMRSPSIRAVLESVVQIRPRVTSGDETTSLNVTFMFRRAA